MINQSITVSTITVSIVSHAHGAMVTDLVRQLLGCLEISEILITRNVPEAESEVADARVIYFNNPKPKGFGANHNAAFTRCQTPFFLVLNPDVRLIENPFPALLSAFDFESGSLIPAGIVSPLALSSNGTFQDGWRRFPRPTHLFLKLVFKLIRRPFKWGIYLPVGTGSMPVDWASGLCQLFKSEVFTKLKGFDEGYFLYYEDVDICVRTWHAGYAVLACPSARLVHDGQRASWRQWQHCRWHVASMLRYLQKYWGSLPTGAQSF